ncbi:uncharacterized protein [Penaeus vannamei]|uniref:uncharacterized protein n=1 Tax=Penaeus vannamei TaxID=6689 RepID=UPI00387F8F5D
MCSPLLFPDSQGLVVAGVPNYAELCPGLLGLDLRTSVRGPTDCTRHYVCVDSSGIEKVKSVRYYIVNHTVACRGLVMPGANSLIPRSKDSNLFLGTLVPSIDPVECPDGQYFNDQHTNPRCDPISSAPNGFCSPLCNPCEAHCTHAGEVTPDPLDCSTYYVCLQDDHFMSVGCPAETPYFDFMAGECQGDSTLCFHNCDVCEPHCTQQDESVPYYCPVFCSHNVVYNRETVACEEGAKNFGIYQ